MDTEPVGKTQFIRALDVIIIGPVMMRAAYELRESSPLLALVLGSSGVATIIYNWANAAEQSRRSAALRRQGVSQLRSAETLAALRRGPRS